MKTNHIPLTIEFVDGYYRLQASNPLRLTVSAESTSKSKNQLVIEKIKSNIHKSQFSTSEIAVALALSDRSASRFVSQAVNDGLLTKQKMGRRILYSHPIKKAS